MAEPTDADGQHAREALGIDPLLEWGDLAPDMHDVITAIAQALADERERARRPFLALADFLANAQDRGCWPHGKRLAQVEIAHYAADLIRAAAQEDPK